MIELTTTERQVIEAFPVPCAIIDRDGCMIQLNRSWQRAVVEARGFLGSGSGGENVLNQLACEIEQGSDYALKLLLGIRDVMEGGEEYVLTYPGSIEQKQNWYRITIRPLANDRTTFLLVHEDVSGTVQAYQELKESREQHRYQFLESRMATLIARPDGTLLDANPEALRLLGYTQEQLLETTLDKILYPDDEVSVQRVLAILDQRSQYQGEAGMIRSDGESLPVDLSLRLYRTEQGEMHILFMFQDISEKRDIQEKLLAEKRFVEVALDSLPGLFVVLDSKGKIVRFNSGFLRDLGYGSDLDYGLTIYDIVVPEYSEQLQAAIHEILEEGAGEARLQLKRRDGEVRDYHLSGRRFMNRGQIFIVASGIDMTDAVRIEKENVLNNLLMNQLFEHSPNGIVLVDSENRVEKCNDAFKRLFGYTDDELAGRNIDLLLSCSDSARESGTSFSQKILSGRVLQKETVCCNKTGKEIPVLLGTVPVFVDGEVVAAYGIHVNLSERVELEEKISRLLATEQKVRQELEVLLLEVHHRVKNNLAVIIGLMDLQMMGTDEPALTLRLKEVQSRIFSIAQIHESIYQHEDFLRVDFDAYIETMIPSWQEDPTHQRLDLHLEDVFLNVNQAVSLGLLTNELFNLIRRSERECSSPVKLNLAQNGDDVVMQIHVHGFDFSELSRNGDSDIFSMKIIHVLLNQLGASYDVIGNAEDQLQVTFQKAEVKGSSSSFI